MIIRTIFHELLEVLDEFPVVALIGPRQCGKTTMARMLQNKIAKSILYLDLELSSDLAKLSEPELFLNDHTDKLIVIDEVQHKPDLFSLLRALVDQKQENCRFLILGSASPQLLKQTAESLTGRIFYLEMAPFSLEEISTHKTLKEHWFSGGYPKSILAKTTAASQRWLQSYVKNYIERDLPGLGLNVSPLIIEKFWRILASYHGGLWNASRIAGAMSLSSNTIAKYLYYLEEAFLVYSLPAFSPNSVKRLVKSPKIYIRDSGLYHYLSYVKSLEELHGDVKIGPSWEGYVVEQVRQACKDKFQPYYYRTHNGAECDLVLCQNEKPIYSLEIKYSSQPVVSRGYYECLKDLETTENYIIVPEAEVYRINADAKVIGLVPFLKMLATI
jgi:predicted AAA+ superfamily ATPase